MKNNSLCVGLHFVPPYDISDVFRFINNIVPIKQYIRDFQFSIHDPAICKSGRLPVPVPKRFLLLFIRLMATNGYNTTLILNQAEEKNFELIIKELQDYVHEGLTGVCTQKPELAKMIKAKYHHIELQSSCLTYNLKYEDFKEEIEAGYSVFNPVNDIIRDPYNLKRNHEMGLVQKILVAEGCLNRCPFEKMHREAVATGKGVDERKLCPGLLKDPNNFHLFLKANWVTIQRMIDLQEYIDVIKLARGSLADKDRKNDLDYLSRKLLTFVDRYLKTEQGEYVNYNILDYTATSGGEFLRNTFPQGIPSKIIDRYNLFDNIDNIDVLEKIKKEVFDLNHIKY